MIPDTTTPLPRITRTVQLDDGSTMFWLDTGAVWMLHPVTGPTCLRSPGVGAGSGGAA